MDDTFAVAAQPDEQGPPFPPRLGRYQLLRRIATGGMAEIFLARTRGAQPEASPELAAGPGPPGGDGIVVIKRMLPQLATQPDFVAMFMDEARLAASMHHPNIVRTFDVGQEGDSYFMVLEYLHGEDLRTLFRALRAQRRRMPLEQVAQVVSHVCAGLQYAHDRIGSDGNPLHVVHRDVSPQNVVVTFDGAVKLLDFGIAKSDGRFGETRVGTLKGKIGYMSPEQCRGEPLDRRSDVFTVAILLFELSTGRRLYRGASEYEVLKRIVEEQVPSPRWMALEEGDGDYPEELDRIVRRGLAKDPNVRYPSAQALAEDLDAFVRSRQPDTTAASLSGFLEQVFGPKIEAWRQAQQAGKDLLTHLAEGGATPWGTAGAPGDEERSAVVAIERADAVLQGDGASGRPAPVNDTPSARPRSTSRTLHRATIAQAAATTPRTGSTGPVAGWRWATAGALVALGALAAILLTRASPPPGTPAISTSAALVTSAAAGTSTETTAALEVVTIPAGATVSVDGKVAPEGAAPRFPSLRAGVSLVVVAELADHYPAVRHVELRPGEHATLTITLEPIRTR